MIDHNNLMLLLVLDCINCSIFYVYPNLIISLLFLIWLIFVI